MAAADHNGDKFHYIVRYRLSSSLVGDVRKIDRWRQNELVVANQPTFAEYEISVEAVNVLGSAPANLLETIIGYSGEDGITLAVLLMVSAYFICKQIIENYRFHVF